MRSLFIALVTIGVGFLALAQFSGEWELNMSVFPSLELQSTYLKLSYSFFNWTASSISYFTSGGFVDQEFDLEGNLGPVLVVGNIHFNPLDDSTVDVLFPTSCSPQTISYTLTPPEYKYSWIVSTLSLGGAEFSLGVYHWNFPYYPEYKWPCCVQTPPGLSFMRYVLSAEAGPFSAVANFSDCCTGITFEDLTLSFNDLSPCCGLAFDMEFYFTKGGFQYVEIGMQNFSICCGLGFDIFVRFTETGKQVTLTPKWVGFGEVCYEIYGNVEFDGGTITALELYGYKLSCSFTECNRLEFVEAFNVPEMEQILDISFQGNETEFLRLYFCGPSCCEGQYVVDVTVFFQPSGSLFGMTRAALELEVPVLANMVFMNSFSIDTSGTVELDVGWRISF